MAKLFSSIIVISFFSLSLSAQIISEEGLKELAAYDLKKKEAIAYVTSKGLPIRQEFSDGTIIEVQYLDESGKPVYFTTHNSIAASTTKTSVLFSGASLGLALDGEDIVIGVWDGGLARTTHLEYEGRVTNTEGNIVSNHATHVSGTILAAGVNPTARGMANQAKTLQYDFNADVPEMRQEAQQGMLLSNHSYGTVLGWSQDPDNGSWTWRGDQSISDVEDYRFGYYSSESASWDDIVFDNPYYLPVTSAGNDRNDTGSGTPPGDGPYDIIGPQGVAKNILTIGSVAGIPTGYQNPSDVQISAFSSWGPTDDGRIKPDLVGVGENVFSASSSGDDQYTSLSGTSMSAPNVTGSLALLQQLSFQSTQHHLLASSLKGLAIHTASEAGSAPGPDYIHGWGLLNTENAAKHLILNGSPGFQLTEDTLVNGEVINKKIQVNSGQEVAVTICWTDPPGAAETVASLDPTNLKLVHDLDLRVTSPSSTIHQPWIIEPDSKLVGKGDNFRDNVERINFVATEDGEFDLSIEHKGALAIGEQIVSIIISVGSYDEQLRSFYFLGNGNQFNNINNWSNESGGVSIGEIPGPNDIIIFDSNSYAASADVVLATDVEVFSIVANDTADFVVDLNMNNLRVNGNVNLGNPMISLIDGILKLGSGAVASTISVAAAQSLGVQLEVVPGAKVNQLSDLSLSSFEMNGATYNSNENNLEVSKYQQNAGVAVFEGSIISSLDSLVVSGVTTELINSFGELDFSGSLSTKYISANTNSSINLVTNTSDTLYISSNASIDSLLINDDAVILDDLEVNVLIASAGTGLIMNSGVELKISSDLVFNSTSGNQVLVKGLNAGQLPKGKISSDQNPKFCFDNINVSDVDVAGNTKFVVGVNSTLTNSDGWFQGVCEDILAADFEFKFSCSGGVSEFYDRSDGEPIAWSWDFGDGSVKSEVQNPVHSFTEVGSYTVELIVSDGTGSSRITRNILIVTPNLSTPEVVLDGDQLRTTAFAEAYQWYLNAEPIPNANDFFITEFSARGGYQIEISNTSCKLVSEPFLITSLSTELNMQDVYPNPFTNTLNITVGPEANHIIQITDINGSILERIITTDRGKSIQLNTANWSPGIYLIQISNGQRIFRSKLLKTD